MGFEKITEEESNYSNLEKMSVHELLVNINKEDKIVPQAIEKVIPQIEKLVIVHRKGVLQIGDVAVLIAVATAHRAESFEACKWLIDTLKEVVPIWKKEFYEDGSVWVAAHA